MENYPSIVADVVNLKVVDKQKYLRVILKLLIDCLVFSHLYYALPLFGPLLNQQLSQYLLRLQHKAVCFIKNLNPRDHDHLSQYYHQLQWLPFHYLVQFGYVCVMFHQYHHIRCIPLESPITLMQGLNYFCDSLLIQFYFHSMLF